VILSICWNLTVVMWTDSTVLVMVGMASCSHGDADWVMGSLTFFFVCVCLVWNWTLFHSCWKKHVVNIKKYKGIITVNFSAPVKSTCSCGIGFEDSDTMLHNCWIYLCVCVCVNRIKPQKVFYTKAISAKPQSTFTSLGALDTLLNWGISLFTIFFFLEAHGPQYQI